MKFKMHYEINGIEDTYIIEGKSIKELKEKNKKEMAKRNIEIEKNNVWSENMAPEPIRNY